MSPGRGTTVLCRLLSHAPFTERSRPKHTPGSPTPSTGAHFLTCPGPNLRGPRDSLLACYLSTISHSVGQVQVTRSPPTWFSRHSHLVQPARTWERLGLPLPRLVSGLSPNPTQFLGGRSLLPQPQVSPRSLPLCLEEELGRAVRGPRLHPASALASH